MTIPSTSPDLLSDLRVVDLTTGAGRLTGRMLADLGADVVRVETGTVDPVDLHLLAFSTPASGASASRTARKASPSFSV